MTPEVCVATVGGLAETGVDTSLVWLATIGLLGLAVGAVFLLLRRSTRGMAVAAVVLVILGVSVVPPAEPAHAAAPAPVVQYGGCTLLALDVVPQQDAWEEALALLPGDERTVATLRVTNVVAVPLRILPAAALDDVAMAAELEVRMLVDDVEVGEAVLDPGEKAELAIVVALPAGTGNAFQSQRTSLDVSVTATTG